MTTDTIPDADERLSPPVPADDDDEYDGLLEVAKPRLGEVLGLSDSFTKSLQADPLTPLDNASPDSASKPPLQPDVMGSTDLSLAVAATPTQRPMARDIRVSRQVHAFFTFLNPEPLPSPVWLGVSGSCAEMLDVDIDTDATLLQLLSGTTVPPQCRPWSHNYAGHQFGFYAGQLGDGRAISLGEVVIKTVSGDVKERWEVQLKGAGKTPYSRFGDGYALVRSSVREFLASEYMAAIGVPTSRALAVIGGSRAVYREAGIEAGAVTARVAPCWVRFGSFELFWYRGEKDRVRELADYVIKTHFGWIDEEGAAGAADRWMKVKAGVGGGAAQKSFKDAVMGNTPPSDGKGRVRGKAKAGVNPNEEPEAVKQPSAEGDNRSANRSMSVATRPNLRVAEERTADGAVQSYVVAPFAVGRQVDVALNRYARFFLEVTRKTAILVAHWQATGFCHGVLNTDNMSILGITIDYGPFMLLDNYNPLVTSNRSDDLGRYRFEHQPRIALWNLSKLGRTLINLVYDENQISDDTPPDATVDSLDIIRQILDTFEPAFIEKYTELMRKKLGFRMVKDNDLENMITPLLQLLSEVEADYTIFFRKLCDFRTNDTDFPVETGPPVDMPGSDGSRSSIVSGGGRRASFAPQSLGRPSTFGAAPSMQRLGSTAGRGIVGEGEGTSSGCLDFLLEALSTLSMEVAAEQDEYKVENLEKMEPKPKKEKKTATLSSSKEEDEKEKRDKGGGEGGNEEEEDDEENDDEEEEEEDEDDDIFTVKLPTAIEIRYRWQKWARAYRSRLLLERAAAKSQDAMEVEDANRATRMKKANPKFSLRNWIMQDMIESIEAMPELTPRDPDIERMEKEFEEALKISGDRQHRLRRDKPAEEEEEKPVEVKKERGGERALPKSVEVIDRAMRIIVGDVWGDVTDADGWEGKDKAFAQEWSGAVPKV
ncbi:hypothetical protein HDU67_000238 [Dinochytrium kinnereticum]|nr:hypothetical protein HDU67_000238 [Dinochytrium kinnereticum]